MKCRKDELTGEPRSVSGDLNLNSDWNQCPRSVISRTDRGRSLITMYLNPDNCPGSNVSAILRQIKVLDCKLWKRCLR